MQNPGQRHYSPSMGRWVSRDPIEERGGIPLYGFVNNAPALFVDAFGLAPPSPNSTCQQLIAGLSAFDQQIQTSLTTCRGFCTADDMGSFFSDMATGENAITIASLASMVRVSEPFLRVESFGAIASPIIERVGGQSIANRILSAADNALSIASTIQNSYESASEFSQGNYATGTQRAGSAVGSIAPIIFERVLANQSGLSMIGRRAGPAIAIATAAGEIGAAAIETYGERNYEQNQQRMNAETCRQHQNRLTEMFRDVPQWLARALEVCDCNNMRGSNAR